MYQFKCVVACECVANIANGCPYIAPAGGNRGGKERACCRRRRVSEREWMCNDPGPGTESASSDRTNMYKSDGRPYGLCCDRGRSLNFHPQVTHEAHHKGKNRRARPIKPPPASRPFTTKPSLLTALNLRLTSPKSEKPNRNRLVRKQRSGNLLWSRSSTANPLKSPPLAPLGSPIIGTEQPRTHSPIRISVRTLVRAQLRTRNFFSTSSLIHFLNTRYRQQR